MKKTTKTKSKGKKVFKRLKFPLDWSITKILPPTCEELHYTPQEFWYKFTQYIERSDKNGEEITISGLSIYAGVHSQYLYQKKDCQDFTLIVDQIMTIFEYRYEQQLAKGVPVSYLMNNRWKGKRESLNKQENTGGVSPDVSAILDMLVYKNNGGKKA